ncbi:MAG TPA: hypothetical protein VFG69_14765 [Nannocystaceae bacterium]|nr:hypothetical protein [Nannocystaceae bacterium]
MIDVVILYDDGCPNLDLARAAVSAAVGATGLPVQVREIERGDAPVESRGFASPTVLVDGRDVVAGAACTNVACRMYASSDGALVGAPPVEEIVAALRHTPTSARRS